MKKFTTKSGFSIELDEEAFDDLEFVEVLAEVDDNVLLVPKVIKMILGEEGKKALYDHVRDDKGRARASKAIEEFKEIMELAGEGGKNS